MKKIKTILSFAVIGSFATLPIILSSCNEKEQLELNGQKLYKNAQLAANYNELKKSNSKTINNINLLFPKVDSKFNKKISINASAFIDWANVEKILKYNEKHSDKQWYKMLVKNLYDALSQQDSIKEFNKSAISTDYKEYYNVDDAYNMVFVNTNNNLTNLYILNNYIQYILDIVQSYKQNSLGQNIFWINNIQDLFKKIVVPSAYIVDPDIVQEDSKFVPLTNSNLWNILNNIKKYNNAAISIFDFPNGDLSEIKNKIQSDINEKNNDPLIKTLPHNSDDDAKIPFLTTDKIYSRYGWLQYNTEKISSIIYSWEYVLKALKDNEDYSLIYLKEIKAIKENEGFVLDISLKFSNKFDQYYTIERNKALPNVLDIGITLNNAIPLTFSMFKNEYQPLIASAIAYILSINNASNLNDKQNKDINSIEFKSNLIRQDKYSYNFFEELFRYIGNIKNNETSLELQLPVGVLNDNLAINTKYSEIWAKIKITDCWVPIFYKEAAAKIN
ncbi:hypothetical protein ACNQ2L_02905 [Mycoplasma sp. T193]|uniref:hypothetical protein n=1 Tax=Mycoplasma sp. T193 TaxID=3401666 RepID=UPI003AAD8447